MESNEQNKLTNNIEADSLIQRTDWQLSEGRGFGELGEKGRGIKKNNNSNKKQLINTDKNVVIPEGSKGNKGGAYIAMKGDLTWGVDHTIQYKDDIL